MVDSQPHSLSRTGELCCFFLVNKQIICCYYLFETHKLFLPTFFCKVYTRISNFWQLQFVRLILENWKIIPPLHSLFFFFIIFVRCISRLSLHYDCWRCQFISLEFSACQGEVESFQPAGGIRYFRPQTEDIWPFQLAEFLYSFLVCGRRRHFINCGGCQN